MYMKKITLLIGLLIPTITYSQIGIMQLGTKTTYDANCYVAISKYGYSVPLKMSLNVLTSAERLARQQNDTLTRRGVGLTDNGNYKCDETTNYLTSALMAGYDTNSVMTALHMLDSNIYVTNVKYALFDTGATHNSIIMADATNEAAGTYGVSINSNNKATGINSLAKGKYATSTMPYSTAMASGQFYAQGDAQSLEYVLMGVTIGTTNDTMNTALLTYPTLATNQLSKYVIELIAVVDTGTGDVEGQSFSQQWQITANNISATVDFVGTPDSTTAERSAGFNPTVTVTMNAGTKRLYMIVHGAATKRVRWVGYVREVMILFNNESPE